MTTPHKATPEQWKDAEELLSTLPNPSTISCILELRDRIEALEAAANCRGLLGSSLAPDDGLVESVGAAICAIADCGDTPSNWAPEARAAILAVARWLGHRNPGALRWAALLREEVEAAG